MSFTDDEINNLNHIFNETDLKSSVIRVLNLSNLIMLFPNLVFLDNYNVKTLDDINGVVYPHTGERLGILPISLLSKNDTGWIIQQRGSAFFIYYFVGELKVQTNFFIGLYGNNHLIEHIPRIEANFKVNSAIAYKNYSYTNSGVLNERRQKQLSIGYLTGKHKINRSINLVIRDSVNTLLLIESPQSTLSLISCHNGKIIYYPNENKINGLIKIYYSSNLMIYLPENVNIDFDLQDNVSLTFIKMSINELNQIYNSWF